MKKNNTFQAKKKLNTKSFICGVDLFCGAGGLTHGLTKGGVSIVAGIDIDPYCRFPYEKNNDSFFIKRDIRSIEPDEISELFKNSTFRLLAGCAPCQSFSTYSQKGRQNRNDHKWSLVSSFGRLVKELQPDFITMENVPQLLRHNVFQEFLQDISQYHVWYKVIECVDYGIPQTRKRLVLIASKYGLAELLSPLQLKFDEVNQKTTVRSFISHFPRILAGETDPHDALHTACSLSKLNLCRIKASRPGGTWRDWDKSLLAKCHLRKSGSTYPSVYGRMEWDAPSPTITTQCFGYGNGRFGHPEQDRAISLREAAVLQTFPDDYIFVSPEEKVYFNRIGRLIGNAVPVRLGEVIAKSIIAHIEQSL